MKRSRELINLGLCKDAENVMQYLGTFYTRNHNGTIMQNSLFEHVPYSLRAFIRYLKHRQLVQHAAMQNGGKHMMVTLPPENAPTQLRQHFADVDTDYTVVSVLR